MLDAAQRCNSLVYGYLTRRDGTKKKSAKTWGFDKNRRIFSFFFIHVASAASRLDATLTNHVLFVSCLLGTVRHASPLSRSHRPFEEDGPLLRHPPGLAADRGGAEEEEGGKTAGRRGAPWRGRGQRCADQTSPQRVTGGYGGLRGAMGGYWGQPVLLAALHYVTLGPGQGYSLRWMLGAIEWHYFEEKNKKIK